MSYGCSFCTPPCATPCTFTPMFWIQMLSISGLFASLFLFFWQYPGTLTQIMGPKNKKYTFTSNTDGTELSIYRDNILITTVGSDAIAPDDINDLRQAGCRGTTLLWLILFCGLFGSLFFLWSLRCKPKKFVCCSSFHEEPVCAASGAPHPLTSIPAAPVNPVTVSPVIPVTTGTVLPPKTA